MDESTRQRQFEDQFLTQLRARAEGLLRRVLPADHVVVETLPDGSDGLRDTLTRLRRYDRDLLDKLPGGQTLQFRFRRRVLGPIQKTVARLRAQVLAPVEALLNDETPGPIGREQVLDALARYKLLPEGRRPTAVVFASPTGFTREATSLVDASGELTLVLLGGREDGGWDVAMPAALRRTSWMHLFQLESQDERQQRLQYHLERNLTQLESRGLAVDELAEKLGVSRAETEQLVRQACRNDARLFTVVHDGTTHVCRSPLADEGSPMSLWSRIRRWLRLKPTAAERVRLLQTQRVRLEQQRHELDERIDRLEAEERSAVEQGAAAKSDAERKQLAGKLMRTRRELRRMRAQANVYTQQIDIIGTHMHHQTLAEQGRRVELPSTEELAQEAAEAEQIMSELAASADLAAHVEVGAQTPMMADEEAAILAEFEQAASEQKPKEPEKSAQAPPAERPPADSARAPEVPPPPKKERDEAAGPELG